MRFLILKTKSIIATSERASCTTQVETRSKTFKIKTNVCGCGNTEAKKGHARVDFGQGDRISTFQGRRRNAVPPLEFVFNFREGAGWQSENYTQIPMEFRGFLNSPRPAADTLVGGTVVKTLPGLL